MRFGMKDSLSPYYISSLEVFDDLGLITYMLDLMLSFLGVNLEFHISVVK